MKLLTFHAEHFAFRPEVKVLPDAPDVGSGEEVREAGVVFYLHAEPNDACDPGKLVTMCAKNIEWLANKAGM